MGPTCSAAHASNVHTVLQRASPQSPGDTHRSNRRLPLSTEFLSYLEGDTAVFIPSVLDGESFHRLPPLHPGATRPSRGSSRVHTAATPPRRPGPTSLLSQRVGRRVVCGKSRRHRAFGGLKGLGKYFRPFESWHLGWVHFSTYPPHSSIRKKEPGKQSGDADSTTSLATDSDAPKRIFIGGEPGTWLGTQSFPARGKVLS